MFKMIVANLYDTFYITDMNIEKDKKSNVIEQRRFLDDWLGDSLFKNWLDKDKNSDAVARCFVCLKTMGRRIKLLLGKGIISLNLNEKMMKTCKPIQLIQFVLLATRQ